MPEEGKKLRREDQKAEQNRNYRTARTRAMWAVVSSKVRAKHGARGKPDEKK